MPPEESEGGEVEQREIRKRFEDATDKVPSGPLGKVGNGEVIGAGGFLAAESLRPVAEFIPGVKQPGYSIVSHGMERKDGFSEHKLIVTAVSQNVARFVAEYASAPSNIDYVTAETEIVNVEMVEQRRTYSAWEFTVHVDERGEIE